MRSLVKGLIVDDELSGRENLKSLIENYCSEIEIIGTASSAAEAKNMLNYITPDVIFLDINMPVLDGFDFLESIDSSRFMIVFVTAHDEYAIRAIKARAIDYLLKPIDIKELQQSVKKLVQNLLNVIPSALQSPKVIVPVTHGFKVMNADEIIRFEAEDCYTHIFSIGQYKITVSKTLKEFEDKVPGNNFFRVHRSHIINLNHIRDFTKLDGGYITMSDGIKIQVSRRKSPEFIKKCKEINETGTFHIS
ncbi:MAG TPA: response regulator [Ignavibacteria bacterium]|nr:response regulator [Ignavibacteria bacterium]HMR41358.1 response regulator [Ignavibacteria bacterium]